MAQEDENKKEVERSLWASGITTLPFLEIRKWTRPLTPEEVTKIYNGEDIDE